DWSADHTFVKVSAADTGGQYTLMEDKWLYGDTIQVDLSSELRSTSNMPLIPYGFGFTVEAAGCPEFSLADSGRRFPANLTRGVAAGDVDGDGDLDLFGANDGVNECWINLGDGVFAATNLPDGSRNTHDIALGDLDGDGDLDAFVANQLSSKEVWLNHGTGLFTRDHQELLTQASLDAALGDFDLDGDLDVFVANHNQANRVWLNDGTGQFSHAGQLLGSARSRDIGLGDLDGDGDLDAFVANQQEGNRIWINQGDGQFVDAGIAYGAGDSFGIALGDLDGDADLDAFVANFDGQANKVWLNNGAGQFVDSGQTLGAADSWGCRLGDMDGDGDLDAVVANRSIGQNRIWLNDGSGTFTKSLVMWGAASSRDLESGDFDGDGDLDIFMGVSEGVASNTLWLNQSCAPDLGLTQSSEPMTVMNDSNIVYTLTVSNLGAVVAQGVVVTDSLPAGLLFDPAGSDAACSNVGGLIVCEVGSLAPSAAVGLAISVFAQPGIAAIITNTAYVFALADTNGLNNTGSVATAIQNVDGDGLPDFLDPDDDNDFVSDEAEALAGTDPVDAASYLWLRVDRTSTAHVFHVCFPSVSHRTYSILSRPHLTTGSWSVVRSNLIGAGGLRTISVTNDARARIYYRVGVSE
ncbi:MAG: FG-GAP-like repeat-containing protein, partial [Verrucomicrobiota bacterium]